ncbi:MAG TPA: HAD family hydrolase [Dermatophilaceae bacterium]|nr:HAD family hydrolase [Dermatophilaceae bacterium]
MGGSAPPVEAVIFDWGGTLTPWHTVDVAAQWHAYAARVHVEDEAARVDLARRILAAEDVAWQRIRGDGSSTRMDQILREVGVDLDHVSHEAALAAYRQFWEPHTFTDPQVQPLWERLRDRGVRVGVLSNTIWPADYHRGVFERDGVLHLIDADVYSSEIPWAKPHPEAFREAARTLGVRPEAAVYVGDRPFEDVHGAQRAGMRAIWVPHSDIPEAQQVRVDVEPDAVAHELLDVLDIVAAWAAS